MKKQQITEKERAAIDAIKVAIRALPRSIFFTVDDHDGVEFWKRIGAGEALGVSTPLRLKRAISQ